MVVTCNYQSVFTVVTYLLCLWITYDALLVVNDAAVQSQR